MELEPEPLEPEEAQQLAQVLREEAQLEPLEPLVVEPLLLLLLSRHLDSKWELELEQPLVLVPGQVLMKHVPGAARID